MNPQVLILGGPTGSGKSRIAMGIARRLPSEIVNADSRQVYRELVIGTSAPCESDLLEIPHHLYGILSADAGFSAAEYERQAVQVLSDISRRKRCAIVVGGTGFYIRALLRGVWSVPPKDPDFRERLMRIGRKKGNSYLHRLLTRVDPDSAGSISVNDTYRVIRALEIYRLSGMRRSELPRQQNERFDAFKLYVHPDRAQLEERIIQRTDDMFRRGWLEEVRTLLRNYPDFESYPAAKSLGYPEIIRHLKGEIDLPICRKFILQKTFRYAKRQLTWFRNQDGFRPVSNEEELHKWVDSVLKWNGLDGS